MNEVFTFTEKGLEKLDKRKPLPFGHKVVYFGYGMMDSIYAVCGEMNEFGSQKIVCMGSPEYMDSSMFNTIDSYSRPLSKTFGIGCYWDDVTHHIFQEDEVRKQMEIAEKFDIILEEREAAEKKANEEERERLKEEFSYLTFNPQSDKKITKSNLVTLLTRTFPRVKFSVKCEHDYTYNVSWVDGPTDESVRKITGMFVDHHRDFTGDYYDYEPSNFNRVFGGFKFVFTDREYSEKVQEYIKSNFNNEYRDPAREMFGRALNETDFPINYNSFDYNPANNPKFTFEVPETPQTETSSIENMEIGDLKIIDYSEKSFVVTGNTKPIKDTLKDLGGKFNFRLSCGAGWVFSKTKIEEVKSKLNLI
jgi:hypothetical protein